MRKRIRYEIEKQCYGKGKSAKNHPKRPTPAFMVYCKGKGKLPCSETAKAWKDEDPRIKLAYKNQFKENMKTYFETINEETIKETIEVTIKEVMKQQKSKKKQQK